MKLAFILQILKDAPLSYSFRLYTYGPYDPQVLEDLKIAERLGGVSSQAFEWQGGMGYEIIPGAKAAEVIARAGKSLEELEEGLDWVVSEFAGQSASDLEIVSTIIYVDRAGEGTIKGASELLARVHAIKPHHSEAKINLELERLRRLGLLFLSGGETAVV